MAGGAWEPNSCEVSYRLCWLSPECVEGVWRKPSDTKDSYMRKRPQEERLYLLGPTLSI